MPSLHAPADVRTRARKGLRGRALALVPVFIVLAGLVTLPACSSSDHDIREAIAENRALWEMRRPDTYSFVVLEGCFCGPPANLSLRTVVEGDSVVLVEIVPDESNDPHPPEPQLAWGRTIDDLFDEILSMADMDPAVLDVTWDPEWGIPLTVSYDWRTNVADDERWIHVMSFAPLD
jgi:hypothetical protein